MDKEEGFPDGQDPQLAAVLSYKFCQLHYRGDPAVVGKTIQLTHNTYTILGVMPSRFTWMDSNLYLPLKLESDQTHRFETKIKLRPGVSFAAAEGEFQPLYEQFDHQAPNVFPKQFKISVRGHAETYTRDLKKTMILLFGAVALLLAIGCCNVSILLLARGAERQHEFAIRSAVGASGFRIVRQLLTESMLLQVTGAGLGIFAAYRTIGFLIPRLPDLLRDEEVALIDESVSDHLARVLACKRRSRNPKNGDQPDGDSPNEAG